MPLLLPASAARLTSLIAHCSLIAPHGLSQARIEDLSGEIGRLKIEKAEYVHSARRDKRRAEVAEAAELELREANQAEKARLGEELEYGWKVRRALEAQVGALRNDRRNQIVGYCVECVSRSRSFDLWDFAIALPCLSASLLTQRSTDGHLSAQASKVASVMCSTL